MNISGPLPWFSTLWIKFFMKNWILLLLFISPFFSTNIHSQLKIEITEGVLDPVRIAIAPIDWNLNYPSREYLHEVISSDLESFGEFEALNPSEMLSLPRNEEEVFYRDWKLLDVDYLVVGTASQGKVSEQVLVSFSIIDIAREKVLRRSISSGTTKYLNSLAHVISDRIYEEINGIPGIYSTKIIYVNKEKTLEGKYLLKLADIDGQNDSVIFSSYEPLMSPDWSSDGRRLAYVSFEEGSSKIYIQELYTGKRKGIKLEEGINSSPSWSPDDEFLSAVLSKSGNPDIYLYDLRKNSWKQLTDHYGIDTEPDWSPNGKKIIFTSNRSGTPQIYEMTLSNKKIRRKTFEGSYNARARYTPDGRNFIFVHRTNSLFHIAIQNLRTGKLRILTDTILDESPTISPNGNVLIYATKDKEENILAGISIDGKTKFILPTDLGEVREPSWSPLLKQSRSNRLF